MGQFSSEGAKARPHHHSKPISLVLSTRQCRIIIVSFFNRVLALMSPCVMNELAVIRSQLLFRVQEFIFETLFLLFVSSNYFSYFAFLNETNLRSGAMSSSTCRLGRTEAKITSIDAVTDRLKATEEALRAAQATIARQKKREQELQKLVVSNGISYDATDVNPAIEAKVSALKAVHEQKVRALMRSINQLQDQLKELKIQESEHRRSALIQKLRREQREQELVIDVLKQTLQEKLPEFQSSRAIVNDFVLKKTVGGPVRFRSKTREELENELKALEKKFQQTEEKFKRDDLPIAFPKDQKKYDSDGEGDCDFRIGKEPNNNTIIDDEQRHDEIEQLRLQHASKSVTIQAQAAELSEAYAELDRLRAVEDQIVRKKNKIIFLREQIDRQQEQNVELIREKEALAEKCLQLQEETLFIRDLNVEDASAKDEERLQLLELIQTLRSREMNLQDESEQKQKSWAKERDIVHQKIRILEKEKKLLVDEACRWEEELANEQKKSDVSLKELHALRLIVNEEQNQKVMLVNKIEELDAELVQLKTLSQKECAYNTREAMEAVKALEVLVEKKTQAVKEVKCQFSAAKLLAHQAKKEKEKLLIRISKLEAELARRISY
ncbi:hypothetical protein Plhal710r2_c005g0022361 [Plasmopara halstedii]